MISIKKCYYLYTFGFYIILRDRNFHYCIFEFAVREDNDRIFKYFFKAMTIYVIMEPNLLIVESLTLHRYNLPLRESLKPLLTKYLMFGFVNQIHDDRWR